jgi:hypothetical protein
MKSLIIRPFLVSVIVGAQLRGPLTLDPAKNVFYTEERLAAFYPPQMSITMGPAPQDFFPPAVNVNNATVSSPPSLN